MKIQARLHIVTAASAAMVIIMALLFYWSQQNLATANKAKNLADEIVSSVFERNTLKTDYLSNDNQRAKDQWLSKQNQINDLLKKVPSNVVSMSGRGTAPEYPSICRLSWKIQCLYPKGDNFMTNETHTILKVDDEEPNRKLLSHYVALFDLAPVGYLTLNSRGFIQEANRAAAAMLGVDQKDLLENEMSKLVFHEDRHIYYQHRKRVFKVNGMDVWEMRMLQSDGSPFWARLQGVLTHNDEYWIAMVDITERKQAEEKLRQWMWRIMPTFPEAGESVVPVC